MCAGAATGLASQVNLLSLFEDRQHEAQKKIRRMETIPEVMKKIALAALALILG
jgi:hypothetical protein